MNTNDDHKQSSKAEDTQLLFDKTSLLSELFKLLPKDSVLHEMEDMHPYECDGLSAYRHLPMIVLLPDTVEQVQSIVRLCYEREVPVVARGAGTGLVGSALNNGIILDMKNFDSIRLAKNHVTIGPGTIKGKLDKKLEKQEKFFPPNPSIGSFCSVGGMLGNNSSGSRSLKYGSVIEHVSEITFDAVNGN